MGYSDTLGKISEKLFEEEPGDNEDEYQINGEPAFNDAAVNDFANIDISSDEISGIINFGSGSIKSITNYCNILQKSEIGSYWTIREEKLNKIKDVYVEFSGYSTATDVLDDKNLLVLYDGVNKGKFTSAVYLLSKLHGCNIVEYDNDIELKGIINTELQADFGYIIDKLPAESLEGSAIKDTFIDALSKKLKELNSHLVITVGSNAVKNNSLKEYAVKYTGVSKPMEMLKKHILREIGDAEAAEELISRFASAAAKNLINGIAPEECDEITGRLIKLYHKELNDEDVLSGLKNSIRMEIDAWFKKNPTLEQRLLMVALSAFSGSEFRTVYTACEDLKKIIFYSEKSKDNYTVELIFGKPLYLRAEEACSRIVRKLKKTEYGQSELEFIEFQKPEFQYAVLEYIWKEYDYFQKYLIEWLFNYGWHEDIKVAEQAAMAVSELLKYDFDYILRIVKRRWIEGKSARARLTAAKALIYYCGNEDGFIRVARLVSNWTQGQSSNNLLWVCAFVYGNIGITMPDAAMEHLASIALKGTSAANVIIVSLLRIFNYGYTYPENYMKVLLRLAEWTELHQNAALYNVGVQTFMKLIQKSYYLYDKSINDNYSQLLKLMGEDTKYIHAAAKLWATVLKNEKVKGKAVVELANWIKYAGKDTKSFYVVRNLLYELVIGDGQSWLLNILEQIKGTFISAKSYLDWLKKFMSDPVVENKKIEYKLHFIPQINYPEEGQALVLLYSKRLSTQISDQLSVIQANARLSLGDIISKNYYQGLLINIRFDKLEFGIALDNRNLFLKVKLGYRICKPEIFANKILESNFSSNEAINPCKTICNSAVLAVRQQLMEEGGDIKRVNEVRELFNGDLRKKLLDEGIELNNVEISSLSLS